jgi:hypothetical protein
MSENTDLWDSVCKTDPHATKAFSGKGGFKGTAISPMWLIRRATELWGPIGGAWGVRVVSQEVIDGAPLAEGGFERLHCVLIDLYYPGGSVPGFGQTMLVTRRKDGPYTDEDAPKKSLTDALTKALSWLGFAADVHMGLFDDVKYIQAMTREFDPDVRAKAEAMHAKALKVLQAAAREGIDIYKAAWMKLSADERASCEKDHPGLKETAVKASEQREVANAGA